MMNQKFALALAVAMAAAAARPSADDDGAPGGGPDVTLLLWNNSIEVPGTAELYSVNMRAQEPTLLATVGEEAMAAYDFVSDSVVCGGSLYTVATEFPIAWGLLRTDLANGTSQLLDTDTYLFHRLHCVDGDEDAVLGVASDFGNNPTQKLQFSLRRYDAAAQTSQEIGVVPNNEHAEGWQGYDNVIEFFPEANEVWVSLDEQTGISPVPNGGYLFVLDLTSGKLKVDQEYHRNTGVPFLIVPAKGDRFSGLRMQIEEHDEKAQWCTFDRSGDVIQEDECQEADALLGGSVAPVCGGSLWVSHYQQQSDDDQFDDYSPGTGGTAMMSQVDPATGKVLWTVDKSKIIQHYYSGAVVCAKGQGQ